MSIKTVRFVTCMFLVGSALSACKFPSGDSPSAGNWHHLLDTIRRVDGGLRLFYFTSIQLSSDQDIWLFNYYRQEGEHYYFDLHSQSAELVEQIALPIPEKLTPTVMCFWQGKLWFPMSTADGQDKIYNYDISGNSWVSYLELHGGDWCQVSEENRLIIRLRDRLVEVSENGYDTIAVLPEGLKGGIVLKGRMMWLYSVGGKIYVNDGKENDWRLYGDMDAQLITLAPSGDCLWVGTYDKLYCSPLQGDVLSRKRCFNFLNANQKPIFLLWTVRSAQRTTHGLSGWKGSGDMIAEPVK